MQTYFVELNVNLFCSSCADIFHGTKYGNSSRFVMFFIHIVVVNIYLRQTVGVSSSLLNVNIEANYRFSYSAYFIPDYVNVVCPVWHMVYTLAHTMLNQLLTTPPDVRNLRHGILLQWWRHSSSRISCLNIAILYQMFVFDALNKVRIHWYK